MNDEPPTTQCQQTGYIIPASFAQRRLWFLDRLEGGSAHYNVLRVLDLRGALDQAALRRSFEALIQRHETLRTRFFEDDGEPVQHILPELAFELPLSDLSGLAEPDREADIRRRLGEAAAHRFDLGCAPLFQWQLLRLETNHHLLLLTFHHILSDGWSMSILNRELGTLYGAHVAGEPVDLPELSIHYADLAVWQRDWLQGEALQTRLDYWCARLADLPALSLPTAEPSDANRIFDGATERLSVGEDLTAGVHALSRSHGVTLFMTLLATLQLLLGRRSGQQDFAVGAPVAGRNRPEIQHVFGLFVNSLVLRADLSGSPSFTALLERVRSACLDAYQHQDLPFERLVEAVQPDRGLGCNPFFDVLINLQDVSFDAFSLPGLQVTTLAFDDRVSKLPLTFYIVPSPDRRRLELKAVYQTARFNPDRVRGLLQQYRHLLQQIVDTPGRPVSEYSLVTPESRADLPDPGALDRWWKQIDEWRASHGLWTGRRYGESDMIMPQQVIESLYRATDGDAYVTSDVGQHQMFAAQYYRFDEPRRWINSGGLGTMGFGLPSAMGVKLAFPDMEVACVTGEGSIQMNIQELSTCTQYNTPVKIINLRNNYLGMVKQWQDMQYEGRYAMRTYEDSLPDFVKLVESYGHVGIQVTKLEDLDAAMEETFAMKDKLVFLDVYIDRMEHVYPMHIAPNGAMKDMWLSKNERT